MRRIFWDTMLLIYLLDENPAYVERVRHLLQHSFERTDVLLTSYVGLGEVMAGAGKSARTARMTRDLVDSIGFTYLPFDAGAVETFSLLRSTHRVKTADAIHLSCAAAAGVDLFLTNDKDLVKLHVPGINFLCHYLNPIL